MKCTTERGFDWLRLTLLGLETLAVDAEAGGPAALTGLAHTGIYVYEASDGLLHRDR
jgi:hypothetical protein